MSALMFALVAGIAVGSDGTERISVETEQHFLGNGYWEGIAQVSGGYTVSVKLEPGKIIWDENDRFIRWCDEGPGRCRLIGEGDTQLGIFKRESMQLIVCMGTEGNRPTGFFCDNEHWLLILKPAKPPKK